MGKSINFRSLAGLAVSAASLLALAPFGVANAAPNDPISIPTTATEKLTIKAPAGHDDQIAGHTFAAVRIGEYTSAVEKDSSTLDSVSVGTVAGVKTAAAKELSLAKGGAAAKAGYEGNPVGEVASLEANQNTVPFDDNTADGSELRKFATNMAGDDDVKALFAGNSAIKSAAATGSEATISVAPGMYMIEDVTAGASLTGAADKAAIPMLVETAITSGGNSYNKIGTLTLGEVNMKVDDPFTVDKKLTKIDGVEVAKNADTAHVGSVLTYKLSAKVPMTTGYTNFRYVLTDHPAADGLTYQSVESVKIGSQDVPAADYTVTPGASTTDTTYDSTHYVIFDLSKAVVATDSTSTNPGHRVYAVGAPVEVTYTMKLNEAVQNGKIANSVRLTYSNNPGHQPSGDLNPAPGSPDIDNNGNPTPGDSSNPDSSNGSISHIDTGDNGGKNPTVYTRHFYVQTREMTRKDDAKEPTDDPTGAVFQVFPKGQSDKAYNFVQVSDGSYMLASDQSAKSAVSPDLKVKDSDQKGSLKVDGLADGTYTVKETQVPTNYQNSTKVTFDVTIQDDPATTPDLSKSYIYNTSGFFNLVQILGSASDPVDADANGAVNPIHVYITTNLSQLPLTGGAGIILAVLLAMALAAAAGSLYVVKRRETAGNAVAGGAKIIR